MKIKTSELEGAVLDWAVARATGYEDHVYTDGAGELRHGVLACRWTPSADWSQGGPLIDQLISNLVDVFGDWYAEATEGMRGRPLDEFDGKGPTALIAAMRAIVAAELDDTVDVPEELLS